MLPKLDQATYVVKTALIVETNVRTVCCCSLSGIGRSEGGFENHCCKHLRRLLRTVPSSSPGGVMACSHGRKPVEKRSRKSTSPGGAADGRGCAIEHTCAAMQFRFVRRAPGISTATALCDRPRSEAQPQPVESRWIAQTEPTDTRRLDRLARRSSAGRSASTRGRRPAP